LRVEHKSVTFVYSYLNARGKLLKTSYCPRVTPKGFDELRAGTASRNAYTTKGFQQWDLRLGRPVATGETTSFYIGLDFINLFWNKNWAAPFNNIDDPFFGIVRTEGLGRVFQATMRFIF
jgi:hypothetical protein